MDHIQKKLGCDCFFIDVETFKEFFDVDEDEICLDYEQACLGMFSWIYKFYLSDSFHTKEVRTTGCNKVLTLEDWFEGYLLRVILFKHFDFRNDVEMITLSISIRDERDSMWAISDQFAVGFAINPNTKKKEFRNLKIGSRGSNFMTEQLFRLLMEMDFI